MKGRHVIAVVVVIGLFVGVTRPARFAAGSGDVMAKTKRFEEKMRKKVQMRQYYEKPVYSYPASDHWLDKSDECIEWRRQATRHQTKGGMSIRCTRVHPAFQKKEIRGQNE